MKDNIFCHIITDIHHESSNNMTHLTHSRANVSRYKTTALIVETGGTVLRFFQTTITTFIEQLIEQDSISPDD